ncbi:lactonase family protein [Carnimonas bestiolae]|uniref:lactonase family protein n=1 Tax=Carnimonas bestiolae TaxID=3402172 RepID=UPI003EDBFADA
MSASHDANASYAVYVANAKDATITLLHLDGSAETLTTVDSYASDAKPGPIVFSADGSTLYSATRGDKSISSYRIDPHSGALTPVARTQVGAGLVYLTLTPNQRFAAGVSYSDHKLVVVRTADLDQPTATPVAEVEGINRAHSVVASPDGSFLYVASLGNDTLHGFKISDDGSLEALPTVAVADGFGPRHQVISSDGRTLYVVSEFLAQVAQFSIDTATGALSLEKISSRFDALDGLKPGFADAADSEQGTDGLIWAADLHLAEQQGYVYVSDRTSSQLIGLDLELNEVSAAATEKQPRAFDISSDGRFAVGSGEQSTEAALYRVEASTGALTPLDKAAVGNGPDWVAILPLGR